MPRPIKIIAFGATAFILLAICLEGVQLIIDVRADPSNVNTLLGCVTIVLSILAATFLWMRGVK